jgi:hypothetical protein
VFYQVSMSNRYPSSTHLSASYLRSFGRISYLRSDLSIPILVNNEEAH